MRKNLWLIASLVLMMGFLLLWGCVPSGSEMSHKESPPVSYDKDIPLTGVLQKALSSASLTVKAYGFSWEYGGMPAVFVEVEGEGDLMALAEKFGINADGSRLFDVWDGGDSISYIEKLPCKGDICTLKRLAKGLKEKVSPIRMNVKVYPDTSFKLDFFLPKVGMTWQITASMSKEDMLMFISGVLDVDCKSPIDNMGRLECRREDVFIYVGDSLGSVEYKVKGRK